MLEGKVTDYGDLLHVERWIVKGRRLNFVWRIGPVDEATPADQTTPGTAPTLIHSGRTDVRMDLRADQKVTLAGIWTDEVGNPVPTPTGASVVFSNDNTAVINLIDNGDGSAIAAATGTLGTANIHAVANAPGLPTSLTADLQIVVVAGLAERFNIVPGTPTEVTPDVV